VVVDISAKWPVCRRQKTGHNLAMRHDRLRLPSCGTCVLVKCGWEELVVPGLSA
jgi:hypothetical protein